MLRLGRHLLVPRLIGPHLPKKQKERDGEGKHMKHSETAWTTLNYVLLELLVEAEQGRVAGVTWSICEPWGPNGPNARVPIQKIDLDLKIM